MIRRAPSRCSDERRVKIAATMRARRGSALAWSPDDVARLRAAFALGGYSAALGEFPDRRRAAVYAAVRRYCLAIAAAAAADAVTRSPWADPRNGRRLMEFLTDRTQFA